jgi:hypothetical protein
VCRCCFSPQLHTQLLSTDCSFLFRGVQGSLRSLTAPTSKQTTQERQVGAAGCMQQSFEQLCCCVRRAQCAAGALMSCSSCTVHSCTCYRKTLLLLSS